MANTKLENIRRSIGELSLEERKEFLSDAVSDLCDSSLTKEECLTIFDRKLSGSRYPESFEELISRGAAARSIA
jgi:hypothetical protein